MFDMIIRNGHVVDPYNGTDEIRDIYIRDGRIVEPSENDDLDFKKEIDAAGLYVFPGLIENHAHVYYGGSNMGINPDLILIPNGVTACIDYGSAGFVNYPLFYKDVIVPSKMTIRSYLNVSGYGVIVERQYEDLDPDYFDYEGIRKCIDKYGDTILGLKMRMGRGNINAYGTRHLEEMMKIADRLNVPCAVHVKDSPIKLPEIIKHFRKGDIWTHMYQLKGDTFLGDNNTVYPELFAAKEKGIRFAPASGRTSYSFKIIKEMMKQGFYPDFIDTDIVTLNAYERPMFSLPYTLSVFLNLGMSLNEVIERATANVAEVMHMEGTIGTLKPGAKADIAIMKLSEEPRIFYDAHGGTLEGDKLLIPLITLIDGEVLYRNIEY